MVSLEKITKLYTHAGVFHADEVFALAGLRLMECPAVCERVSQLPPHLKENELAFDIGGGRFDHHGRVKEYRKDGTPYAAFGLIMREFYSELGLTEDEYYELDMSFIRQIDATDNGYGEPNLLSIAIHDMNPCWDEDTSETARYTAFMNAVDLATKILKRTIYRITARHRAKQMAEDCLSTLENHVVYLDQFIPLNDHLQANADVHWLCYPSERGGWALLSLNDERGCNKAKFPYIFRGKPSSVLPKGMTFCHRNGFLGAFDSVEDVKSFVANYLYTDDGPNPSEKRRLY